MKKRNTNRSKIAPGVPLMVVFSSLGHLFFFAFILSNLLIVLL